MMTIPLNLKDKARFSDIPEQAIFFASGRGSWDQPLEENGVVEIIGEDHLTFVDNSATDQDGKMRAEERFKAFGILETVEKQLETPQGAKGKIAVGRTLHEHPCFRLHSSQIIHYYIFSYFLLPIDCRR
jgi:hypothetical protein